jgi:hypothetical protein
MLGWGNDECRTLCRIDQGGDLEENLMVLLEDGKICIFVS